MSNIKKTIMNWLIPSTILVVMFLHGARTSCSYDNCPKGKPGMINVHIVPHTHDDVGWLTTVDQYYYRYVQYILNTVVQQLAEDPNKRFIYVESAFFYRWWNEQHDRMRHLVKRLVRNGQFEFILGGWSMNDEATTHYSPIIDQHTLGFQFLKQNFGECGIPKIGWQIDPFGHSREQASIFAQFGFDGLFFGRLDQDDKNKREKEKTMEMLWNGSPNNLGSFSTLFTGVLPNGYNPPDGFNFGWYGADDIKDDKRMKDYNLIEKLEKYINQTLKERKNYKTEHIINTMGTDFNYFDANVWYTNLDKLIKHMNERQVNGSKINLFYSTPSCYLYALHETNETWPTKSDDFFPYASEPHTYWTGYFTSRPALKRYAFEANAFLQVVKQLDVLSQLDVAHSSQFKINQLRRALGVLQHHDAISGTEKQVVAYDYAQRLTEALVPAADGVVNPALRKLMNKTAPIGSESPREDTATPAPLPQMFCPLLNISQCSESANYDLFTVTGYNPVGWERKAFWVRLPVEAPSGSSFLVNDPNGNQVLSQIVEISEETKTLPGRKSKATHELVFPMRLPALGFATYLVYKSSTPKTHFETARQLDNPKGKDVVVDNGAIRLTFDGTSGKLAEVANLNSGQKQKVIQDLLYYDSHPGNNTKPEFRASGAYIFRPLEQKAETIADAAKIRVVAGKSVTEVRQIFTDWATQVIRLYKDSPHFEVSWTIGPIPVGDGVGKEIISRFSSDLTSDQVFYTDSNGREMQRRKVNFRPTWKLNITEPVAGNYYPVNSRIYIKDLKKDLQLTVLTDRSQGGSSLNDGQIELMLHRRCLYDDAFGVDEALNETGISGKGLVVRGSHFVFLHHASSAAKDHRPFAQKTYLPPSLTFSPSPYHFNDYSRFFHTSFSGLKRPLPPNVHLLTLEPWEGRSVLLRLEHFYEAGEDPILSKPATVDVADLFAGLAVGKVTEKTLGANRDLANARRLVWRAANGASTPDKVGGNFEGKGTKIVLKPMQIRTFVLDFK